MLLFNLILYVNFSFYNLIIIIILNSSLRLNYFHKSVQVILSKQSHQLIY